MRLTKSRSLLVSFLLASTLSSAAHAGAFAGKTRILVDGYTPYWVPLSGGPATAILPQANGGWTTAAYNGTHFFLTRFGSGLQTDIYDEESLTPATITVLDDDPSGRPPQSAWDGSRYVAAWYPGGDHVRAAALNGAGVIVATLDAPPGTRNVYALAAGNGWVLAVDKLDVTSTPKEQVIVGMLFDQSSKLARTISVSRAPSVGQSSLQVMTAKPFAGGFYVVFLRADSTGKVAAVGRLIFNDGTMLPEQVLDPEGDGIEDIDVVTTGGGLLAVMKRLGIAPVRGTFVGTDGSMTGPQPLGATIDVRRDIKTAAETVRLPNGALAIVSILGGVATMHPIRDTLAAPLRRRGVRH